MYFKFRDKIISFLENPYFFLTKLKKIDGGFIKDLIFIKSKLKYIPKTIIDVGSSKGDFIIASLMVFPEVIVYAFEPIRESYDESLARTKNKKNVYIFDFALGDENKVADFYLNYHAPSSSFKKMDAIHKTEYPFTSREKVIKTQIRRFDSINNIKLVRPILVKIDVQGFELEVIEGMGDKIKLIDCIEIEISFKELYKGVPKVYEITKILYKLGFKYFVQRNPRFSKIDNKINFADFIFFK